MRLPTVGSHLRSPTSSLLRLPTAQLIVIGCVASFACSSGGDGGPGPQPSAANIAIVSGSGQTGVITLQLPNALVVAVTDADGNRVSGFTVQWSTAAGMIPATSTTGSDGHAQATWTLGTTDGDVNATAGNPSLVGATKSVSFSATALSASAAIVSGDNQTGVTRGTLANPLIVELKDANNNPVQGKQVTWAASSGGGSVNPTSSTSGANGRAQTAFTAGCQVGTQSATATAASFGGSPVTFQASVALGGGGTGVDVGDNFFEPASVTICAGQQVTWTWVGGNPHNVVFDAGGPNSTTLTGAGNTFSRTFATPGAFTYICTVHGRAAMSGTVVVQ